MALSQEIMATQMQQLFGKLNGEFLEPLGPALRQWVTWLMPQNEPSQAILSQPFYWDALHVAFDRSLGHANLQKFCLHILRQSVFLLNEDVNNELLAFEVGWREEYLDAINKFCSFFETIVIGRYMNQIKECLGQFPDFSEDKTGTVLVKLPWWTALLKAALQQANSDLIRNLIGTYVFENYVPTESWLLASNDRLNDEGSSLSISASDVGRNTRDYGSFLEQALLPWALHGRLLKRSARRAYHDVWSDHGDRLAVYCTKLVSCEGTRCYYVETILRYLVNHSDKLNGHSPIYALQGLNLAPNWNADLNIAELAIEFATRIALSKSQRAMLLHHCLKISNRFRVKNISEGQIVEIGIERLEILQRRQALLEERVKISINPFLKSDYTLLESSSRLFDASKLTLEAFEINTRPTATICDHVLGTCLHGDAVISACQYLVAFMDSIEPFDSVVAAQIISRTWLELEAQEYPRAAARSLSKLIFHPRLVQSYIKQRNSNGVLVGYIKALYCVCLKQIDFWNPFAEAIRVFCIAYPALLKELEIGDVFIGFLNEPPTPNSEVLLDTALAMRERNLFGSQITITADESCGYACMYDVLNRIQEDDNDWGRELGDCILEPWLNQVSPVSMVSKWKRTAQLQALILSHSTYSLASESNLHPFRECSMLRRAIRLADIFQLSHVLSMEPLPRHRFLLEWLIISKALDAPQDSIVFDCLILTLESMDHANPKLVTSLIKITTQLTIHGNHPSALPDTTLKYGGSEDQVEVIINSLPTYGASPVIMQLIRSHFDNTRLSSPTSSVELPMSTEFSSPRHNQSNNLRLLCILNSFIASSKIQIKHESMWSFNTLFEDAIAHSYAQITKNPVFVLMNSFLKGLEKYKNPPEGRILEVFDASKDRNLRTLFQGGYLRLDPAEPELVRAEDFERIWAQDATDAEMSLPGIKLPLGPEPNATENVPLSSPSDRNNSSPGTEEAKAEPAVRTRSTPLQTKAYTLTQDLPILTINPFPSDESDKKPRRNGPIIIASLIENPHNLGGLSRVAEIFGCSELHIPDLTVLKNTQFQSVSVNSEQHIPFVETKPSELPTFLQLKKTEGWTIIGIEQTDSSIVLGGDGNKLPEKAVIVMGAERTGIPAVVLLECDVCLEIKQFGVTRSLNVQTAAACALFEWRRAWGDGNVER